MKAHRLKDKVDVKIGDVVIEISPLSFENRTAVQAEILIAERNRDPLGLVRAARLAMKHGVKGQRGITYHDDSEFLLEFDAQGDLTDSCLDELLLADSEEKLKLVCMTLAKGFPSVPIDDQGNPIEGILIEEGEKSPEKK